jgi:hypothetical protein
MTFSNPTLPGWLAALVASVGLVTGVAAQDYGTRPEVDPNPYGGYRVAAQPHGQPVGQPTSGETPYQLAERSAALASRGDAAQAREHPLMPAIRWATEGLHNVRQIQDYSAVLVKREQVDGKLCDEQYMFVKVRHRPMSVYLYFLKPDSLQGQEVIWIEGQNDGKMWAHGTGLKSIFGTVSLHPKSAIAMEGNRYPITDIGMLILVERLLEVAKRDKDYGECEVQFFPGAKINDRACTCIQVVHPMPKQPFLFHIARIFIDDELNVPIRYEAYDWPSRPGELPPLMEQYTYLNLKLNNGFSDADFDVRNPQYGFRFLGLGRN